MDFTQPTRFTVTLFFLFAPFFFSGNVSIETAKLVLEKIYHKAGKTNRKMPNVKLVKDNRFIAEYDDIENEIKIGIGVFSVCNKLGVHAVDALAIVLGHELDHFFKAPDTNNQFAEFFTYMNSPVAHAEAQADINGLFYAYLAGYTEAGAIYDDLIKALYEHFQLSENMKDYPPLSKRLKTNEEIKAKAANLYTAFEMGNYFALMGKGHFEKAIACYEFVLDSYQGAELNNNLAVTLILSMIESKKLDGFYYPIALVGNSQLKNVRSDAGLSSVTRNNLENVKGYFEKALTVSPSNTNARLGIISIDVLLGNFQRAFSEINVEIASTSSNSYKGKLEIIKAIALIKMDEGDSEKQGLKLLAHLQLNPDPEISAFAAKNLRFAKYEEKENHATDCTLRLPDLVDNIDNDTDFRPYLQKNTFSVFGIAEYLISIHQLSANSKLMAIQDKAGYGRPIAFQELANYPISTDKLLSSVQWQTGMGGYTYFPECNLLFKKDENHKITCIKIFK